MSGQDRERWDERYRLGAYVEREHPSAWLVSCLSRAPVGRALDVACGPGRNALYLAERGYAVTGIDVSPVALARAAESAAARGVTVDWRQRDLDDGPGIAGPFDLVVLIRYVDLELVDVLCTMLAPGGCLIVEEHLATHRDDVVGPRNPAFRVAPGALGKAARSLTVVEAFEGETTDPDGRAVVVARLLARRAAG